MTPWSETSKKQRNSVYTGIGLSVLCAVYCLIIRRIVVVNGESRFFDCVLYAFKVVIGGSFDGIDGTAFAVGVSGFVLLLLVIGWGAFAFISAEEAPYGEARFATGSDIKKMGLLDEENASGIIVGKSGQRLLSPNCLRHGIALAPTRSGKTAGFVIPSALSFKGSLVIVDPKGELEKLLAKPLKKEGKTVYALDWSDERAKDAWNPLSLKVSPSVFTSFGEAERQAERIAAMLVGQKGQTEDHWETNAKKHIAALILLAVYLAEIAEQRLDPNNPATVADYETYREPHLSRVFGFVAKDVDVQTLLSKGAEAVKGAVVRLIAQDFAQIKATYGDKAFETIKTNCSYLLVYAQNNYATQKELAEMVGKATRKRKSVSKSGKSGVSVSENDEGLDLIPVADWGAIPFGRHVLLCQNFLTRPVWCKTPLYFKEKRFTEMLHG